MLTFLMDLLNPVAYPSLGSVTFTKDDVKLLAEEIFKFMVHGPWRCLRLTCLPINSLPPSSLFHSFASQAADADRDE
eukprot:9498754-Pyramimonas_sp.AAC.1